MYYWHAGLWHSNFDLEYNQSLYEQDHVACVRKLLDARAQVRLSPIARLAGAWGWSMRL